MIPLPPHSVHQMCVSCRAWRRSSCGATMTSSLQQYQHYPPAGACANASACLPPSASQGSIRALSPPPPLPPYLHQLSHPYTPYLHHHHYSHHYPYLRKMIIGEEETENCQGTISGASIGTNDLDIPLVDEDECEDGAEASLPRQSESTLTSSTTAGDVTLLITVENSPFNTANKTSQGNPSGLHNGNNAEGAVAGNEPEAFNSATGQQSSERTPSSKAPNSTTNSNSSATIKV